MSQSVPQGRILGWQVTRSTIPNVSEDEWDDDVLCDLGGSHLYVTKKGSRLVPSNITLLKSWASRGRGL